MESLLPLFHRDEISVALISSGPAPFNISKKWSAANLTGAYLTGVGRNYHTVAKYFVEIKQGGSYQGFVEDEPAPPIRAHRYRILNL